MADYAIPNDIRVGSALTPSYRFGNASIVLNSLSATMGVDVIGNQLSVDTFSFTVRHVYDKSLIYKPVSAWGYKCSDGKIYRLRKSGHAQYTKFVPAGSDALVDADGKTFRTFAGYAADRFLAALPFGTPVIWNVDGAQFLKGYIQTVDRVGKYAWKVTCISGIGLLASKIHAGGIYAGGADTFGTVAADIIGSAFTFSVSEELASAPVYGHLPYGWARDNLHQLLFAFGAAIVRGSGAYEYEIRYLSSTETDVPDSRIALGGSVTTQLPANAVEVTEHAFIASASDEIVTLFDNMDSSATAEGTTVVFDAPMHDLAVTGTLTISASNANYAIVSGVGVLTGKKYVHTERIVAFENSGGERHVKRVTGNHLISFNNSINAAKRVLDYYSSAKTLKAKIQLAGEMPGANLSIADAFGELCSAYLSKLSVSVSSVIAAQCELIEGYTPKHGGNNYDRFMVVTASGPVIVPAGATQVRFVLIGGADGGQGGYDGEDGYGYDPDDPRTGDLFHWPPSYLPDASDEEKTEKYRYEDGNQPTPLGGAAGAAGSPGKINIFDRNVTPRERLTVVIGEGGEGGQPNGGLGAPGGDTTVQGSFGTLSSASGTAEPGGYFDPIEQQTYGGAGADGYAGGDGGLTDTINTFGSQGGDGLPGGAVGQWNGGPVGVGVRFFDGDLPHGQGNPTGFRVYASGGASGGAAWGHTGGTGQSARQNNSIEPFDGTENFQIAGLGGIGASADAPGQAELGVGGSGGNGGGAGGNSGGGTAFYEPVIAGHIRVTVGRARGGKGSVGGKGGDGLLIMYFSQGG